MKFQHTVGHVDCAACESLTREATDPHNLSTLNLKDAWPQFMKDKSLFLQPRTRKEYAKCFKTLLDFFGDKLPLGEFTIGNVRGYQRSRMDEGVGAIRINHEINALGQLMKEAGLWQRIKAHYKPLRVNPEGPGVALTKEEAQHLFRTAAKNSRWQVALWVALISVQTTAGPGELQHLQLRDINIEERTFFIRRAVKNRFRVREQRMNNTALFAMRKLLERAIAKGAREPHHYLLPGRARKGEKGYDPNRPQDNWNKAWTGMRKAAGFPKLRRYDLRHTGITFALADPTIPIQVVVEMAGWVDEKMIKRYSHQRTEAKRLAAEALDQLDLFKPEAEKKRPEAVNLLEGLDVQTKVQ